MALPLLAVEGLTVRYRHRPEPVLERLTLALHAGETCGLSGESGSGKTTLGWALTGLLPPQAEILGGSIRLRGEELLSGSRRKGAGLEPCPVAMVSQDPGQALNPVLRVGTQVEEVVRTRAGLDKLRRKGRVAELFEAVGLVDPRIARAYPGELSGGQQQRVVLAQALATESSILVADEPTSALDDENQGLVLQILSELKDRLGLTVLFISHDIDLIRGFADRIVELRNGTVRAWSDDD